MIYLYYFSNGSRNMKSIPLSLLKPMQPYRIVRLRGDDRVAILHLKEAGKEEFVSCMFRDLIPKFREAVQQNSDEAVGLKLKFYGLSDAANRLSGSRANDLYDISCERDEPSARDPDICTNKT